MNLLLCTFTLVIGIYICEAGYGTYSEGENAQSDVRALPYLPPSANNMKFEPTGYPRKYSGTKSGYAGTKTGYTGTKTGYTSRKTSYAGTKTGYTGTKTSYAGTKTGYAGTKTGYGERRSWHSSGAGPTYNQFHGGANEPYTAKCEIECKNNGICVDTNICQCPPNYQGQYCEFEKKPCLLFPPLPMNSHRKCSPDFCTISCAEGHKFMDGTSVTNMRCVNGQWQPTRADLTSIPDCQPECSPPCLNGGACLSVNTCQCPADYRGPQCQYAASVCDVRKLGFNGGYSCMGDNDMFSCKLSCPTGASLDAPAVERYTCLYSTGIFEPQPIPHCVFNEVIIVTPSNYKYTHSIYSPNHTDINRLEHTTEAVKYGVKKPITIVVQDFTPKSGSCLTWAGVHYKTFDGKIYSFQSPCEHILVRDSLEHKFTIAVRHPVCERQGYCPSELIVYLQEKMYTFSVADDGSVLFRSTKRLIPVPAALPGIRVSMPSDQLVVALDLGLTLKWDTNNLVVVEASVLLWNKTEGLCGTLDGNPENEMKTKEKTIAKTKSVMIASWELNQIGDNCDSSPTETSECYSKSDADMKRALQFCTTIFSKEKFRKCSKVMDVSQLLEACQWDYCACLTSLTPEECACRTVSVYAKECLRHGMEEMRNWRDTHTCPMTCPEGKIYDSCGPDVQASCSFPESSNSSCVEGCFCPPGLLLEAGRCVKRSECPCRLRNQSFPPGTKMPKNCNTCTCSSGSWSCSGAACGARCSAVGDPHYTTFDGRRYDFMGHCTYTLLKTNDLIVEVENVACSGSITEAMNLVPYKGEGKPSCTKAVNLIYNGANVHLKQGGFILINGKEINSLPVTVGDIKIRAASSLFVIIQLPMKVDLWWDGNTRVFLDVPSSFQDKTKGLCGTFNLNQQDDFLTPEGDVEQTALAFANKWKTREFCDDLSTEEPEHPCKANIENKDTAEKYCNKLKTNLFESCHWYVDVQPFYEDCLYDMCACAGDVSHCLCPILGAYGDACARSGVMVQWRYHVKECELQCTGGQEYTVCADSCLRTCADVSLGADCKPQCVEGCACPVGQVLDNNNVCVPIGLCPCYHKGMEFKPGYKEVRAGRRERELCTCVGAHWSCSAAIPGDEERYPPADDLRAACSAADHREFTTCELAEPLTCKNMHLPPTATTQECRPGCQCKKGYVMDASTKKCVLAAECPCHHGGRSYPDGHTMQESCNTCECNGGKWSCTTKQCQGVCGAWGDSHVTTFDGQLYDFEGVCTYLLAKGTVDGKDGFSVEIQNEPCGTTGATCSKLVTLRVGGGGDDDETVSLTKSSPLPDTSKLKRIKLRLAGAYVFLDVPSLGATLQWDRGLRVYVKLDTMWQNRVKGLCGNFNSDLRDDFQTPSGGGLAESSPLLFADSWKLKSNCPKPQEATDHCKERPNKQAWASATCGALKRFPFSLCHSEVPASSFVSRCEADACACDSGADCDCACAALAAYAAACSARGVAFKWRSQELCPMQCDEECSNYDACMSPCPPETCDNTLEYSKIKATCENETCVEGCKLNDNKTCPDGTIYSNSSLKECVPRAKCKPVCMTLSDGREVVEGEVIEEDACHTCRCSKKERVCTGQPCPTDSTGPTVPPETTPYDQPMTCKTGWTEWLSRGAPEISPSGASVDNEPLPQINELTIGSPMCKKEKMTQIECRTVGDHRSPKETGLNVECSLEKGLICSEPEKNCPDFEIRVQCECEDQPFQCLDSTHPSHPHPSQCALFFECSPSPSSPGALHAVLKSCGVGLLYNPSTMVCDWPASVALVRPECGNLTTTEASPTTTRGTTVAYPSELTSPPATTAIPSEATTRACPPRHVYKECALPCDQLCDHFTHALRAQGQCQPGQKCADGCVEESVATVECGFGSRWRDRSTCVTLKDCTCDDEGQIIKPGGVVVEGCQKCQCLDNALHCDSSECVSIKTPIEGSTHSPMIFPTPPSTTTKATTTPPTPTTPTTPPTPTTPTTPTTPITPATSTTPTTPITIFITNATTTIPTSESIPESSTPVQEPTSVPPTTVTIPLIITTTVSPPPECSPDRYIDLLWSGEPLPSSSFSASSVANALFEPQYAILDGHPLDITAGSWNPAHMDKNQYIQVELPQKEPIYGIKMQGSPLFDQYVTSYDVMYGDDGNVFSTINGPDEQPKIFRGPVNNNTPLKQMFEPPIEAKFVRIRPLSWHEEIAIRFELIGCQEITSTTSTTSTTTETSTTTVTSTTMTPSTIPVTTQSMPTTPEPLQCTEPLGIGADLPIEMIEVSSNNDARPSLKLTSEGSWTALYSTPGEWIMFNFSSPRNITGIKTKGGDHGWVTGYNVMYTSDLATFNPVVDASGTIKLFPANFDEDTEVMNEIRPPLHAQYLKVLPVKWHNKIEMRVEPIGCFEPYPTLEPPRDERLPPPCPLCPGVPPATCTCTNNTHYDGENCVPRDQCPCLDGFIPYPVGASYRGASCAECVCKLGGVPACSPAADCRCQQDLVPTLTDSCKCLCEPCAEGTRICPTSKVCLALDKWCDGLQDCPDDERDCTTRAPVTETVVTTVVSTVGVTPPTAEATTVVPTTTTEKPVECPKVECPPGYFVKRISTPASYSWSSTSDLPPPRPRYSYQRYYKGGYSKGGNRGYAKGGFSKTGYSKGGFSKGGRNGNRPPTQNEAFNLVKPALNSSSLSKQPCEQFKCIPILPPPPPRGSTPAPLVCSAPTCPPTYALKLEKVSSGVDQCPQYACVPPPERLVFCNMTGRTFTTFDGSEYKYDVCFHILARENRLSTWTIFVRKKCRLEGCANELLVLQDDQFILVKPNLMIEYDNYEYTVEQTSKICFQKNSFDVNRLGNGLSIKSRKYNFTVLYSTDGDVKIGVSKKYLGQVDGLCGLFDGDASNDRSLPRGQIASGVEVFGRAWAKPGLAEDACRTRAIPPDEQRRVWDLCKVITEEPISQCSKVLNLDKWRSICLEKICKCAELVVNGTKMTEEKCRCLLVEKLVAECLAADKNIDVAGWRIKMGCPAECPPPLVHYDCFRRRCEPRCAPITEAPAVCDAADGQCFPGCYCPEGTLRKGDACVAPADCLDCTCTGVGSPAKYTTFEGDDLPFLGNCTYVASRDRQKDGGSQYQVYATNGPCAGAGTCTAAVHLVRAGHVLHVTKDSDTKKLITTVNGTRIFKYPYNSAWATITLLNGQDIHVKIPELHLELTVLQAQLQFTVSVPSSEYGGRTEGLCGVCAGYQDHLITSNGTTTDDFELYGKSWQAGPEALKLLEVPPQEQCGEIPPPPPCVLPPPESNPCYNLNNIDKFGACHALVEPQSYIEQCESELCELNSTDACSVLERYAAECRKQGVCLDWRTDLCPYPCETPLVYRKCVDCERTCENYDELKNDPKLCDKQPVEGCFCPEGKVKVNDTCIEPSKCFPCDTKNEHYVGDEWQEDACTQCACSMSSEGARVSCRTRSCAAPVCASGEERVLATATRDACCKEYVCVPKPPDGICDEPKQMECGFGQVLKLKSKPDGCTEFLCECKPESECEKIPDESSLETLEPGMERVVERGGCCPRVELRCRPEACPAAPACPALQHAVSTQLPGHCCTTHSCELPKDKCLVTLEWEAASKGGEKPRTTPQVMLKDTDSAWLDGPCRSCRCESMAAGLSPQCHVTSCPTLTSTDQFVVEPHPVPFACCPEPYHVACRDGDNIYKVGENWTSPSDPCESYQCSQVGEGQLEKVTTVQNCNTDCELGWQYFPAEIGSQCCGRCRPVACVVDGITKIVGAKWTSTDFCTNYTCADVNGTLQVQSANESCPEPPASERALFVLSEERQPETCCMLLRRTACRSGDLVYQEGEIWQSSDPCKNYTCSRDESGVLMRAESVETCRRDCPRGYEYSEPSAKACCGRCVQTHCELGEELRTPDTTWKSADNCTSYSCENVTGQLVVTSSRELCPDVSACNPANLINDTCCQICKEKEKPQDLSKCVPVAVPDEESVGLIRVNMGPHGLCVNREPLKGFKECRGSCDSGTLYNNQTGSHDSSCECCQALRYSPLLVSLQCPDGSSRPHRVASPAACACRRCGELVSSHPTKTGYSFAPSGDHDEIPEIYARFGSTLPPRRLY